MNKLIRVSPPTLLCVTMIVASASASAHGPRRHYHGPRVGVSVVLGAPLWYPAPIYHRVPSYYYNSYPPMVASPVYGGPVASPYWYYCQDAAAYYPYVKHCPGAWQRVPAQPPPR